MKKLIPFVLVAVCAAALSAQPASEKAAGKTAAAAAAAAAKPAEKKPAAPALPVPSAKAASPAAAQADGKSARAKAAQKQGEEGDDGTVMIDSKAEIEDSAYSAAQDYAAVPGGIPSSYGQCKGVTTEGGRTILIFESIEDGSVTFVHVTFGKNGVSWKLLDKVGRSAD